MAPESSDVVEHAKHASYDACVNGHMIGDCGEWNWRNSMDAVWEPLDVEDEFIGYRNNEIVIWRVVARSVNRPKRSLLVPRIGGEYSYAHKHCVLEEELEYLRAEYTQSQAGEMQAIHPGVLLALFSESVPLPKVVATAVPFAPLRESTKQSVLQRENKAPSAADGRIITLANGVRVTAALAAILLTAWLVVASTMSSNTSSDTKNNSGTSERTPPNDPTGKQLSPRKDYGSGRRP